MTNTRENTHETTFTAGGRAPNGTPRPSVLRHTVARFGAIGLMFGAMIAGGLAAGCTPVQSTVSLPSSTQAEASARSLNHATLRDDGSTITATNPNGNNYAALNAGGSYSNQVTPIGSAAIGAAGVFVSDPKDTAAERVAIEFVTIDQPRIFFADDGSPYTMEGITETRAVPASVIVDGFNTDISGPLQALRQIAEVEAEKFASMEASERAVFLEEIRQRGDLYRQLFADALDSLDVAVPEFLGGDG